MTQWLRRLVRDDRGSVTAAWVSILGVVFTLGMVIAELAHYQYTIRALKMAADRAAEASAMRILADGTVQRHSWARVEVQRYQWYKHSPYWVCVDYEWEPDDPNDPESDGEWVCVEKEQRWHYDVRYEWVERVAKEEELEGYGWKKVFECYEGGIPWEENGHWGCIGTPRFPGPEKDNRWITWTGAGEITARRTFDANWTDRDVARVTSFYVTQSSSSRSSTVTVSVRFRPIFFSFLGDRTYTVQSKAVVQMRPFSP